MSTCGFDTPFAKTAQGYSTTEYTSLQSLISNYHLPITTYLNSAPEYPNICRATTNRLICPVPS